MPGLQEKIEHRDHLLEEGVSPDLANLIAGLINSGQVPLKVALVAAPPVEIRNKRKVRWGGNIV